MALNLVSPGVQIREVDLTIGAITSTNDQVGAFSAPFTKGPVNQPVLVTNEAELLETFGKPTETDGQNEYWLSASNYLSYGGVLRVVRATGLTLNNANSDAQTSLQILNDEDYETNHTSDTAWEYAARTPGSWANNLKVCTIDGMADQIMSGIGTTATSVTTTTTVATKTGDVGITTNLVTGITTSSLTVADIVTNSNLSEGTTIQSIGASVGSPMAPAKVLVGAAVVGLAGKERDIFKIVIPYILLLVLLAGIEAIIIDPKEAFRVVFTTKIKTLKHITATAGNRTVAPPPAVATPFPPRSRRVRGAT